MKERYPGLERCLLALLVLAGAEAIDGTAAVAQGGTAVPSRKVVEFDALSRTFKTVLPFDEPFFISAPLPKGTTRFRALWGPVEAGERALRSPEATVRSPGDPPVGGKVDDAVSGGWSYAGDTIRFTARLLELHEQNAALIPIDRPLSPDSTYRFEFIFETASPRRVERHTHQAKRVARGETEDSVFSSGLTITVDSTVTLDRNTRTDTLWTVQRPQVLPAHRVDLAFGPLLAARARYAGFSLSAHWYFLKPLNKDADFARLKAIEQIERGLSLFAGMAVFDLWRPDRDAFQPLTSAGSAIGGASLRLHVLKIPLRLQSGVIVFQAEDPHPLSEDTDTKADLFAGLSADFAFRDIVGPLIALVGIK